MGHTLEMVSSIYVDMVLTASQIGDFDGFEDAMDWVYTEYTCRCCPLNRFEDTFVHFVQSFSMCFLIE